MIHWNSFLKKFWLAHFQKFAQNRRKYHMATFRILNTLKFFAPCKREGRLAMLRWQSPPWRLSAPWARYICKVRKGDKKFLRAPNASIIIIYLILLENIKYKIISASGASFCDRRRPYIGKQKVTLLARTNNWPPQPSPRPKNFARTPNKPNFMYNYEPYFRVRARTFFLSKMK